jgi:uncharacterized protein
MLLIVFYGVETLEHGIAQLTLFFTHYFFPIFAEFAIENASVQCSYETDSLALKFIFYILLVLSTVIVAPVSEEFIFRGVILHRLATKWGVTAAVILSSFLFGIAHMNIYSIPIGISSIFVALIYIKTQTLIVPIAFHAMHNAMAVVYGIIRVSSYSSHPVLNTAFAIPILIYFLKRPNHSELMPYTANTESPDDHLLQSE